MRRFVPNAQILVRYTAEGSPLENDMIVYLLAAMGMRRNMGGRHEDVVGMGANLGLNLAFAKGEVRLSSGDYRDQPYLDYNLAGPRGGDLRRFRDGVRLVVSLEDHPAMAALIERRVYPEDPDLESDEALDSWIEKSAGTGHHVSCTAKMGPSSEPYGRGGPVWQALRGGAPAHSGRLDNARVRPGQHQRYGADDSPAAVRVFAYHYGVGHAVDGRVTDAQIRRQP